MKAIAFDAPGPAEVLTLRDVPAPALAAGEVLVDVAATAVNQADLMQRQGRYPPPPGASSILGLECSGTIAAVGAGVSGWHRGDQVCALLTGGGYAEQVAVPAGQVLRVPEGVDLISAAALPEVACTVWSMVFADLPAGQLSAGETLLVHGGSSGIGTMAIQLAKAAGASVFTTAGSAAKLEACRALGADVVINYRQEDFASVVGRKRAAAGFSGVDVILDTVGGRYLNQNVSSLATNGRIAVIGFMGGISGEVNLSALMAKRGTIFAASLRSRPAEQKAEIVARTQAAVWPLIERGAVRPVVHAVLPLSAAIDAHRLVSESMHVGKVVLTT